MSLSTIIVIHSTPGHLAACLEAIQTFTESEHRLIVVDAAGRHDRRDRDLLAGTGAAALHIVDGSGEKGPIKACNVLLEEVSGHQLLFLDSTAIVSDQWLARLGHCLETAPLAGGVGPLTDGHYTGLPGTVFGPAAQTGPEQQAALASPVPDGHRRIAVRLPDVVCLGVKPETIRELGYLDETLDEVGPALADLCLRAELAGYQNYLAGDVYMQSNGRQMGNYHRKALRDKWENLDPESDLRRHYEALALCHRANQARQREETERAVELFLKGIGLCPVEGRLYLDLAAMLADGEHYSDALQTLREMPEESSSPARQLITGICQRGMGQPEAAQETAARILTADGQAAFGWWLQGTLLVDQGADERAETAFRKSITADPGYGPGYTALGNIARRRGNDETGLDLLERGFTLAPDCAQATTAYHSAVSQLQAYPRAIPVFSEAAAAVRSSRRLRYRYVDVLLKAGEQALAMDVIQTLLVDFSLDEGLLAAALAVRERLGRLEIEEKKAHGATIAFCLIVRDEEGDLPRCMASIQPVADEIIVVDTGSRDRTRDVARVFGARVFDFQWCDDFSAAKNFAAGKAVASWIFSIDADEVLSPQDHADLRALVRAEKPGPVAYAVTTRNYLKVMDVIGWQANDGRYPEEDGYGWMPSEKVRLFPNDRRVRFTYPVHEMVEPSLEKSGIRVAPCDIPIHHYGKLDQTRSLAKGKTYYQIGVTKLEAMQTSVTGIRELAVQAQTLGDFEAAERLWKRVLTLEPGQALTYVNLGTACLELGKYAEAVQMAHKARRLDPSIKESHFNFAVSLLYTGDARGAVGVLEKLVKRQPTYLAATFMLAAAHGCAGNGKKARGVLNKLQHTSIGAGLPEALLYLAGRLKGAEQEGFARSLEKLLPG